jgi:leucyl/phenylalanyl-tRNA--protein transferase
MVGLREPGVRSLSPSILRDLVRAHPFPDPRNAPREGLLAYGGDLEPERLLAAYAQGVFPWYDRAPILWFSPDPRVVLLPSGLRINRTLAKNLRRGRYDVRMDTDFRGVIEACARVPRPGQDGTWITSEMIDAYTRLHDLGFAHSVECWAGDELVGGIYGVSLGAAFFGESMFARASDASKIALVHLVRHIEALGFHFLDCQAPTPQTTRLGAVAWPRDRFLEALARALGEPTRYGRWTLLAGDGGPREARPDPGEER